MFTKHAMTLVVLASMSIAACNPTTGSPTRSVSTPTAAASPLLAATPPSTAPASAPTAATSPHSTAIAAAPVPTARGLTRVADPSTVCMVNNQYMHTKQIPVVVGGKTYFGCCEMCKGRLERETNARMATDPVTGSPVDKADAVIGRDAQDKVFYFESEASFLRYGGG